MKADYTNLVSMSTEEINHDIDIIISELKQVKCKVNNASKKELESFDLDATTGDLNNLLMIANMLMMKVTDL